jgi:hypothetical protein
LKSKKAPVCVKFSMAARAAPLWPMPGMPFHLETESWLVSSLCIRVRADAGADADADADDAVTTYAVLKPRGSHVCDDVDDAATMLLHVLRVHFPRHWHSCHSTTNSRCASTSRCVES